MGTTCPRPFNVFTFKRAIVVFRGPLILIVPILRLRIELGPVWNWSKHHVNMSPPASELFSFLASFCLSVFLALWQSLVFLLFLHILYMVMWLPLSWQCWLVTTKFGIQLITDEAVSQYTVCSCFLRSLYASCCFRSQSPWQTKNLCFKSSISETFITYMHNQWCKTQSMVSNSTFVKPKNRI